MPNREEPGEFPAWSAWLITGGDTFRSGTSAKSLHDYKFWPSVARVGNVFGDRDPVCSCVGMENSS